MYLSYAGSRVIEPECPVTLFVLMIQLMVGMFLESFAVGLIYSKLSRSPGILRAIRFSSQAVICQRNGQYVLAFRVWNIRRSPIINPTISAVMVRHYFPTTQVDATNGLVADSQVTVGRTVSESLSTTVLVPPPPASPSIAHGAVAQPMTISDYRTTLRLESESGDRGQFRLFIWPSTVIHRINAESPLWTYGASELQEQPFEIIVTLDGTTESTGSTSRFMTSYLSCSEIHWGHRLVALLPVRGRGKKPKLRLDCSRFDDTERIAFTPRCSAKIWAQTS